MGQELEHDKDGTWLRKIKKDMIREEQTGMSTDFAGEAEEHKKIPN